MDAWFVGGSGFGRILQSYLGSLRGTQVSSMRAVLVTTSFICVYATFALQAEHSADQVFFFVFSKICDLPLVITSNDHGISASRTDSCNRNTFQSWPFWRVITPAKQFSLYKELNTFLNNIISSLKGVPVSFHKGIKNRMHKAEHSSSVPTASHVILAARRQ